MKKALELILKLILLLEEEQPKSRKDRNPLQRKITKKKSQKCACNIIYFPLALNVRG